jgi:hypothetical protein
VFGSGAIGRITPFLVGKGKNKKYSKEKNRKKIATYLIAIINNFERNPLGYKWKRFRRKKSLS